MKRTALALPVLVLTLGACGVPNYAELTAAPAPVSSSSETITTVSGTSDEDSFIAVLEQEYLVPYYGNAAEHLALAHDICDARASGAPKNEVLLVLITSGYTPSDAGYLYGAATAAFCSQYAG